MSSNLSALFDAVSASRVQPSSREQLRAKRLSFAQLIRDREDALQRACDERWARIERLIAEVEA